MGKTLICLTEVHFPGFQRSIQGLEEQQRPRDKYKFRVLGLVANVVYPLGVE